MNWRQQGCGGDAGETGSPAVACNRYGDAQRVAISLWLAAPSALSASICIDAVLQTIRSSAALTSEIRWSMFGGPRGAAMYNLARDLISVSKQHHFDVTYRPMALVRCRDDT